MVLGRQPYGQIPALISSAEISHRLQSVVSLNSDVILMSWKRFLVLFSRGLKVIEMRKVTFLSIISESFFKIYFLFITFYDTRKNFKCKKIS